MVSSLVITNSFETTGAKFYVTEQNQTCSYSITKQTKILPNKIDANAAEHEKTCASKQITFLVGWEGGGRKSSFDIFQIFSIAVLKLVKESYLRI